MSQYWYAVYTQRSDEIKLRNYFIAYSEARGLDYQAYLPLVKEVKKWSDRKKIKQVPLFKNYLFIKHDDSGFHKTKQMPGFGDYIRFGKYPSVIPEEQIRMIKTVLEADKFVSCKDKSLIKGEKVRICDGPMAGFEGVLIKDQTNLKVAIEVKHLNQCLQVSVPIKNIEKL